RRRMSFTVSSWQTTAAPGPRSSISPMWLTDRAVLLRGPAVGERHLPARELAHPGAERAMDVEERRAAGHTRALGRLLRGAQGVGEQHRDRHRSHPAGNRSDVRGALARAGELDVAAEP